MKLLRASIAALACFAASPLMAQAKQAIPADIDRLEDRSAISRFGDCIVARDAAAAAHILQANYTFDEAVAQYPEPIAAECQALWTSSRPLEARAYLVQFAIAESLIRAEAVTLTRKHLGDQPPLRHRIFGPREVLDASLAKFEGEALRVRIEEAAAITTRFGECVVRQNPEDSRALLSTLPNTIEEQVAFEALLKANKACAGKLAAGKPCGLNCREWFIDFTRVSYRGGVAVSYYRLAHSTPAIEGERPNA